MKRILAILSVTALCALFFIGCGEKSTIQSYVQIGDAKVTLGAAYDDALATALGTPQDTKQAVSCHYDGYDTVYTYDGFTLYAYQLDAQQIVYSIEITDAALPTPEGATVGMTVADVEKIYGAQHDALPNGISYPLDNKGAKLNFRVKNDAVFCIEYYTE